MTRTSTGCARPAVGGRRAIAALALVIAMFVAAAPPVRTNPAPQKTAVRVISLVPAVTEMLFAIGAGPEVVGVSSFDQFPPEVASRPRVGALIDPDFERILTLKPDMVVVYGSQTDLMNRLTRASIPHFIYRHAGLADVTSTIRELGTRVGRTAEADRVASSIDQELTSIRARVANRPRPRTALIFGREPGALRGMYASGGVGFLHDLLMTAGGANAFADVARESLQVSTEALLARAPDVILEVRWSEGWNTARLATERGLWRSLPSLPAVRNDRIYLLANSAFAVAGPRVASTARAFADVLHGNTR